MTPQPPSQQSRQPWQARQSWQQRPELRIGDAERERAAGQLAEHYAVGRITQEEHAERLDRIWAARTQSELAPVFVDLPGGPTTSSAGPRLTTPRPATRRWRGLPWPLAVLLVVVAAVAIATNLPLILIGLGVWFFFLRGSCGTHSSWGHPRRHW